MQTLYTVASAHLVHVLTNFCLPVFFTKTLQTPGLVVLCLLSVERAHTLQRGRIKDAETISA